MPGVIRVRIPSPLFSYTGGKADVDASGATLEEVLADLDRRHPGFRFRIVDEQGRIRSTILIYVDGAKAADLRPRVREGGEVMIVAALSGG
jgi:molybdopterin converting factor small subunit